jgi:hypothetical protein
MILRPINDKKTVQCEFLPSVGSVLLRLTLGGIRLLRRTQAFYCRWDSISKGQSCFKLLKARVRLPQTSLMRSEDRSVSQAILCRLLSQATAAESHPDPVGSTQEFGSTTFRSISSSSLLAHLPEQHRTFGEVSLLGLYMGSLLKRLLFSVPINAS